MRKPKLIKIIKMCGNCRFYWVDPHVAVPGSSHCHAIPPIPTTSIHGAVSARPIVLHDGICGLWQRQNDEKWREHYECR